MNDKARTVRLEVELLLDNEPIAGRITRSSGGSWSFVGWMALVRAIEDAMKETDGGARRDTTS